MYSQSVSYAFSVRFSVFDGGPRRRRHRRRRANRVCVHALQDTKAAGGDGGGDVGSVAAVLVAATND